jgi:cytochrome o ubiquinol oxidase subunit II
MKKKLAIALLILLLIGIAILIVWFFKTHNIPVLNPKGMIAVKQRTLIVTALSLMLIVVIPVFILTVSFILIYRASNPKAKYTPDWAHNHLAECFWWGIPCVIIAILAVITWKSSYQLSPFKPIDTGTKPIVIQVVALDWKWLFIYPEQEIATVNFIQFPEKTPISFEITADAPMNSFWIPQLGGQIYAMPAMRTQLHLIANETGNFRGSSANISGVGFAGMYFTAKASTQQEFEQWVDSVKLTANRLDRTTYETLASPSEYNPVAFYELMQKDLFDWIVMKYTYPSPVK